MGSTGALIFNPHLNNNALCFKCLNSIALSKPILNIKQRRPKLLGFSNKKYFKKFSRIVCSAVEDVTDKQREISSGSLNGAGPAVEERLDSSDESSENPFLNNTVDDGGNSIYNFLYPSKELLPDDKEMTPVKAQGVRFLQLAPGEFFFTSLKVSGYCGLLLGSPVILYEIIAFVVPGLTKAERRFLGPVVLGSSILFYTGIIFSYYVLTPAALTFFVTYAEGVVESLWSIDQYFEFVLVLMFSTGLSFQVPVIQLLLGQLGLVSSDQMLSIWRYVVVGSVVAAAILTPSTDPLTQMLLAGPLMGLYLGGAGIVKVLGR
ncbi:UNVERIFIED_CONTAM: Sec-independent protein translocase protein TATC, chloroplastic [Sesamum angustifolium]|uniref:Sec-independent protein translocase protein TATC, chloroplastic n=1 Tax=Sesamum angustifolium TaxID=2727405 RepID=A0AAW2RKF6_9LAMI